MKRQRWYGIGFMLLGALGGITYGVIDLFILDRLAPDAPRMLHFVEEFVDLGLPVLLGITLGWGIHLMRIQRRLNRQLSLENSQLQRHVWTNALIAQVLHDIRNPLHNLAAAMEDALPRLGESERDTVSRNLGRLEQVTTQYSRWAALLDTIDPSEQCDLAAEVARFIRQKARSSIQELHIAFRDDLPQASVAFHPLLLESALVSLFSNAFEALADLRGERHLTLTAEPHPVHNKFLLLTLSNNRVFPETVLKAQGKIPLQGTQGLGVGLLLVRKMISMAGGDMQLRNLEGWASVQLSIPGTIK